MNPNLVKAAAEVITNPKILVNMVSQRVRQLCLGHRPMVEFIPGLVHADIALSEIAAGKLSFESTLNQSGTDAEAQVVEFPGIRVAKAKKKAAYEVCVCAADAIDDLPRAAGHMRKRNQESGVRSRVLVLVDESNV